MDADDGILLNLAGFDAEPAPQSRKQTKVKAWSEKKALRRQKSNGSAPSSSHRPNFRGPSHHQREASPSIPKQSAATQQLKGYSLEPPAPGPVPVAQSNREPPKNSFNPRQSYGGGGGREERFDTTRKRPREDTNWQNEPRSGSDHPGARPYRDTNGNAPLQNQQQQQRPPRAVSPELYAQQPQKEQEQQQAQQKQQQQPGKWGNKKDKALKNFDPKPERIGRLRLASRHAGYREATPDQEDIRPPSDADSEDILAVVSAAAQKDKAFVEEIGGQKIGGAIGGGGGGGLPKPSYYGEGSDSDSEQEGYGYGHNAKQRGQRAKHRVKYGPVKGGKKKAAAPNHDYQLTDDEIEGDERFKGSSSEEEEEGLTQPERKNTASVKTLEKQPKAKEASDDEDADLDEGDVGVIEFDPGTSPYLVVRKKRKKDRREAARATAGPAAPAVRRGELTHAVVARPEDAPEVFGTGAINAEKDFSSSSDSDVDDIDDDAQQRKKKAAGVAANTQGFSDLGLCASLADHMKSLGFERPTGVQQQAIPFLVQGRDALVKAPTGSGKTLVYLAPILHALAQTNPRPHRTDGSLAIIIAPTRELCLQVADVLTLLARRFAWIVPGCVYGGENRNHEKAKLRKGVTVLVATPGRLLDHLEKTQAFKTDKLKWLVLDEADRLLDLGFEKKLAEIVSILEERTKSVDYSATRQTVLLSATLHSRLSSLAGLSLENPAAVGFKLEKKGDQVVVDEDADANDADPRTAADGSRDFDLQGKFEIPKQLKQRYMEVPCKLRLVALAAYLRLRLSDPKYASSSPHQKLVVFFSNCDSVEFYHAVLANLWPHATGGSSLLPNNAPLLKLHGNMVQAERTSNFLAFSKATHGVLLCTDVAARGLDFPYVTGIIQFDPPGEAAEYVHRVGRTARLGQSGEAMLFVLPTEVGYIKHLESHGVVLKQESPTVVLDKSLGLDYKAGKGLPLERHHGAFQLQKQLTDAVTADRHIIRLASDAFRSYVRAYATHSGELKSIFHIKSLHLGHVAHSFALTERPALVGRSATKDAFRKRKGEEKGGKGGKRGRKDQGGKFGAMGSNGKHGYVLA